MAAIEDAVDSTHPGAFFDNIGKKYEDAFSHDKGLIQFVHASLGSLPAGASILDVGSGTGKPVAEAAVGKGFKLHGIDISSTMVDIAQAQVPGASFEVCDALKYQPPAGALFDGIFALLSHFWMSEEDVATLITNCQTWLKPGGSLFIGTVVADDLVNEDRIDPQCRFVAGIPFTFMGETFDQTYFTRKGWDEFLSDAGLEQVNTSMVPFQPPIESRCDPEPHYYISARKPR